MNEKLPEEVVTQILECLPVISLMRFKCVCKSWNALITHQNFITKHLLHKKKKKKKKNCEDFLVHRLERTGEDFLVSLLSYETLQQVSKSKPLPPPYPGIERYNREKYENVASMVSQNILPYSTLEEWIVMPLGMKKEAIPSMDFVIREYIGQLHVRLVGSVNGLVCLHDTHWHHILIWNPATGETKVLPGNRLDYIPIDYCFGSTDVGFGFDAKTNDYKVIIVATAIHEVHHPYFHTLNTIQGEVYSLNSNSWRRIDRIRAEIHNHTDCRTYTNGMFSWYGACDKGYCLWSFDISNEVFLTTPLPAASDFNEKCGKASFVWNELVALAIYYADTVLGSETCFDIWLLHEFGVEESWTKLITIGPLTQINRPLGFWKNEYCLFLENTDGQLVLYDFSTQEMTDLHIDGIPSSLQMLTYMESLVSVRGGNELQEQESS